MTTDTIFESFNHPDVEMSDFLPQAPSMDPTEAGLDVANLVGSGSSRKITLVIPDSLREFPLVVAWQDLQPRDTSFDDDFITQPAKVKIEEFHNVALVIDEGQKVVFIGGSDAEVLSLVQGQLSTLLQDSLVSGQKFEGL